MKKLLLLSILLIFGLTAAAQRRDQNRNSQVLHFSRKQPLPLQPGNSSRIIPVNSVQGTPVKNDWHSSPNFDPTWANRFQTVLDSVRIATNSKGFSLAVLAPGQGLLTCVSGISSPGVQMTQAMRFGIMSNTKLFIAVTMAKLQEQGVLTLDDHLSQWLHNYPHVDPATTIRQLLSHQSGIFDYWNDFDSVWNLMLADTSRYWTPTELLACIKDSHFEPGNGYRFSNTNFLLAGMVIEAATGSTWIQKMHEFILNPLTMDSTFAGVFENRNGPVAAEWLNATSANTHSPMTSEYTQINAAGALLSTAQEMAEWYHALFNGTIISATSLQQIEDTDPSSWYSLGLQKSSWEEHKGYSHWGDGIGYESFVRYDPQTGTTFCMLMNNRYAGSTGRIGPLLDVLYLDCPKKPNDAGISEVLSPWEMTCGAAVAPKVTLTNFGSNTLTTVKIYYQTETVDTPSVFNWTGALGSGDTIHVTLPPITLGDGSHWFTFYTSFPNGVHEEITYNDTVMCNFVVNTTPSVLGEISEGFDSLVFPPAGWTLNSFSYLQWGHTPLAHSEGTGSVVAANYIIGFAAPFNLDMPVIHIAAGTHPELSFDYAYAMYPGYSGDSLQVLISSDCGATWEALFNKGSQQMFTAPPSYDLYFPKTSAEWVTETFSLASYTGDVLIRFREVSGWGNNLYLDNVKVSFPTGITDNKRPDDFKVYPNPASDAVTISGLPVNSEIQLLDLTEKVLLYTKTENNPVTMDIQALRQGVYLLKTPLGTKKIVKL